MEMNVDVEAIVLRSVYWKKETTLICIFNILCIELHSLTLNRVAGGVSGFIPALVLPLSTIALFDICSLYSTPIYYQLK